MTYDTNQVTKLSVLILNSLLDMLFIRKSNHTVTNRKCNQVLNMILHQFNIKQSKFTPDYTPYS